jgi:hypothetical protein
MQGHPRIAVEGLQPDFIRRVDSQKWAGIGKLSHTWTYRWGPQLYPLDRLWEPGGLMGESWDTHGSLMGDNIETPGNASSLRRDS